MRKYCNIAQGIQKQQQKKNPETKETKRKKFTYFYPFQNNEKRTLQDLSQNA